MRLPILSLLTFALATGACERRGSSGFQPDGLSNGSAPKGTAPSSPPVSLADSAKLGQLSRQDRASFQKKLSASTTEEIKSLTQSLSPNRNHPHTCQTFALVAEELARRDPQHVMEWFVPKDMIPFEAGILEVSRVLAETHPDILEKWLLEHSAACQPSAISIFSGIAEVDARMAIDLLGRCPIQLGIVREIHGDLFYTYAEKHPAEAEQLAEATLQGKELSSILSYIANAASRQDPAEGFRIAEKIQDPFFKDHAITAATSALYSKDPDAVLARFKAMNGEEASRTLSSLHSLPGSLLDSLLREHPTEASELLTKVIPTNHNNNQFLLAIKILTTTRPELADSLIAGMPDGKLKSNHINAQAQHIATLDSRAALDRALSQTDTASRDAALEGIATSVGKEGISTLLELTANLPPEARGVLFSRALPILIESDPQDISTHLPEILRDNHLSPETIKAAYSQLATHLAGQRQHDTRAWLDTVPSEYQSDAMKGIATRMAQRDLRSLATFLDTMPKDTRWETGVKILITDLENIDPKMHTHWQSALREAGYE